MTKDDGEVSAIERPKKGEKKAREDMKSESMPDEEDKGLMEKRKEALRKI